MTFDFLLKTPHQTYPHVPHKTRAKCMTYKGLPNVFSRNWLPTKKSAHSFPKKQHRQSCVFLEKRFFSPNPGIPYQQT
eukprot:1902085-Amphidinium_carterae.10